MKKVYYLISVVLIFAGVIHLHAQIGNDLDLSTKSAGVPPSHVTVGSVAKWIENPLDQKVTIAVTNLYADATNYLSINIDGQLVKFCGAGMDGLGHYVPTNYAPVIVNAVLRREYPMSIMCPNSGPQGSSFFKLEDFSYPANYIYYLTNDAPVSTFIWSNITTQAQTIFTNDDPDLDPDYLQSLQQTNLVVEMNRLICTMSFYTNGLFENFTNYDPIPGIMATNPTAQQICYVNRLLLYYGLNFPWPNASPDNTGTAQITFGVKPPPELQIKKGQPAPNYTVLLNRDSSSGGVLNLMNPGTGYSSTNNPTIEIIKDKFGHFGLGDGCDDATKAPGQGGWLSMGPGCTEDTNRISLEWHVSLGRTFDGLAAGQLAIAEPGLTRDSYTPFAIYYNGSMTNLFATETIVPANTSLYITNSDGSIITNIFSPAIANNYWSLTNVWTNSSSMLVTNTQSFTNCLVPVVLLLNNLPYLMTNSAGEAYTNYDSVIRQVKGYQTFVDVVTPNTNQTVLNFYFASQVGTNRDITGLYTNITGSPFVTWTIQNPEPATVNKLDIIENRQGVISTQSLVKTSSAGGVTWSLTLGGGAEQRLETRQVSFSGSPAADRTEINTIKYGNSSSPAYKCQETYHSYPWGWELKETRIPNSPADLVTTYEYYDQQLNANDVFNAFYDAINADPHANLWLSGQRYYFEYPDMDALFGYSQLKYVIYPDGYWEKRVYTDIYDISQLYYEDGGSFPYGAYGWAFGWLYDENSYAFDPFLRFVFTPSKDSDGIGPNDANMYNANFTYYRNTDNNRNGSATTSRDCFQYTKEDPSKDVNYAIYLKNDYNNYAAVHDGPEGDSSITSNESGQTWHDAWYYGELKFNCKYSGSAPIGLAGHFWDDGDAGTTQSFTYFDHGVYNSSSGIFVIDLSNCNYKLGSFTNYPDYSETKIITTSFVGGGDEGSDLIYSIQGHSTGIIPCYSPESGFAWSDHLELIPYMSQKTARIFHNGNLSQTEQYVYTGLSGDDPQWALLYKIKYYVDSLGRATNVVRIDGSQSRTLYTADYRGSGASDGDCLVSETDENGKQTIYSYDSLQRIIQQQTVGHGAQPNLLLTTTLDANGQTLTQTTSSGGLSYNASWSYDAAGRLASQIDRSGLTTQIAYSSDNRTKTVTGPGGLQTISDQYLDRRQKSVQGSAVVPQFYDYGVIQDPFAVNTCFRLTTNMLGFFGSSRYVVSGQDAFDQHSLDLKPAGNNIPNIIWTWYNYNAYGSLVEKNCSGGAPRTVYWHDFLGNIKWQQVQPQGETPLSPVGYTDGWHDLGDPREQLFGFGDFRSTSSDMQYVKLGANWYYATTNYISLASESDEARTMASIHLEQLTGLTANTIGCTIDYDADTNKTITTSYLDRVQNKLTVVASRPNTSSLDATNIYQNGQLLSSSTFSVASPTRYFYDALSRTNQIQSPLGQSAYITYDPMTGWMTSQIDFTGQTTTYQYYGVTEANAGKLKCQTGASGKKSYFDYTTRGELFHTWGDASYPTEYHYSEYGDLTNLITFRSGGGWTASTWPASPGSGDNTYWQYDEASGALLKKTDALGRFISYSYNTNTGQLFTRTWARTFTDVNNNIVGITVTNRYDGFGDLVSQQYNDGTPDVYLNNYNRSAQPNEVVDGSGTNELTYDFAGRLVSTYCGGGLLNGIAVTSRLNPYYGRNAVIVTGLSTLMEDDYGYDIFGRLATVSSGTNFAAYSYLPNSCLLQSTTCYNNGAPTLAINRLWEYGSRLKSIANIVSAMPVTSHNYQYDVLNRRTKATLEDGSVWQYGYNDHDELTNANRSWYSTTIVPGQQFTYTYDNIGNRISAGFGGDTNGANIRMITYTNNGLNQYVGIITPGFQHISGVALASNSVTVNGGLADRYGEYFHREINVPNTNQPVWQNVTNIANAFTNKGGFVFPANGRLLIYDADGNLTADGIWTYQWDGENRLVSMAMVNVSNILASNRLRLDFAYDYLGRRVQKTVLVWNIATNGFVPVSTNRFVYDRWNLLAVADPQDSIIQSFVWGQDLSGTMTKAGGVGGLLMVNISGTNCFTTYDGNGNITSLVNVSDKSLVARYEYSPYGELLRESGPLAHQNPFRFSTKFEDDESALVYYGYRYYSPILGRWINRDPIGEKNNKNMYGFVRNHPVGTLDVNGEYGLDDLKDDLTSPDNIYAWVCNTTDIISDALESAAEGCANFSSIGNVLSGQLASITVGFAPNDLLLSSIGSEVQEINFDKNAERIITDRLNTKTSNDIIAGLVVGVIAAQINASGGDGDSFILDAALGAAGTEGVDSSETIWGVATDVSD